jgi:DNA invertase Pin-like site-specific DNA recombinase
VAAVGECGAALKSLHDAWADTTTPHGKLMLTILGGLAEFERSLIKARCDTGMPGPELLASSSAASQS